MKKETVRAMRVELPLGLVFVFGFLYFHATLATAVPVILKFTIALLVIFCAEIFIHESGHIICGLWYGVPLYQIQVGYGPAIKLWQEDGQVPVSLGLLPFGGHVEFQYLPVSRRQRIVMYTGGVGASCLAAIVAWNVIPDQLEWLRTEIVMACGLFIAINLFGTAPKEQYSDGDAIRGLLAYT